MLGHRGQPLIAAHDVADLHQVIVDHHAQVVGGKAVALEQHQVVQGRIVDGDRAVQHVVKDRLAVERHRQTDDRGDPLRFILGTLRRRQGAAVAVVADVLFVPALLLAQHGQPLLRAVAVVGKAVFYQPVGIVPVEVQPLRLVIGAIVAAYLWALIPIQAQPAQAGHQVGHGLGVVAGAVGVLDAHDELAAMVAGKEPVKQRRPRRTDVKVAGRAGCDANADLCVGHSHPPVVSPAGDPV